MLFSWIFMIIPLLVGLFILIFWTKKVVWWELFLLFVPSALIIVLFNTIMVSYNTSDTEYYGSYVLSISNDKEWNERVSCRHPVYCERQVPYECGDSKKSKTCYRTEEYVCGYEHPYDVDFHPEIWYKKDNIGYSYSISKTEYNTLKKQFKNKEFFVDLHRNYHTIDGDRYMVNWNGEALTSDVISYSGSYVNRTQASYSLFKFSKIDTSEVKQLGLFKYPKLNNRYQDVVLGYKVNKDVNKKLQFINGFYGQSKQFRMFILVFKNKPLEIVHKQRSYWEGGNKNEFVICLSINDENNIEWVDAFSWMDKPTLEVEVEEYFNVYDSLDLDKFSDWLPQEIENKWKRKEFKDFDYIQVELTDKQLKTIWIVILIYNILISLFIINNKFENILYLNKFNSLFNSFYSKIKNKILIIYNKIKKWKN